MLQRCSLGRRSRKGNSDLFPFESHGYAARENILHMLREMDTWHEKYVKGEK